jgi:hypothetical protein
MAELLVVLLVVAVTAAAVVPVVRGGTHEGGDAALRELGDVLGRARAAAVTTGVEVAVVLELAGGAYVVVALPDPALPADTLLAGVLPLGAATLAGPGSGRAVVVFDGRGLARAVGLAVLEGSEVHEIRLDPWTGRVVIER